MSLCLCEERCICHCVCVRKGVCVTVCMRRGYVSLCVCVCEEGCMCYCVCVRRGVWYVKAMETAEIDVWQQEGLKEELRSNTGDSHGLMVACVW